jgi:hypothetical protein
MAPISGRLQEYRVADIPPALLWRDTPCVLAIDDGTADFVAPDSDRAREIMATLAYASYPIVSLRADLPDIRTINN